jgi:hypothetical protein
MKMRFDRICFALLGSAALALMGCDSTGDTEAEAVPKAISDFTRAADALAAGVGAPGEQAEMPPPNDPAVQAFEQQANMALTALGTPEMPVSGLDSFETLCGKTAQIAQAYVSAGASPNQPASQELMQQNVLKHLDQMLTPTLFSAHCGAAHLPFMETLDTNQLEKEQALKKVRNGSYAQFVGLLQTAAAEDLLKPDQQERAIKLLSADASKFATAMSPEQRKEALAVTQQLRGSLPAALQGDADKIGQDIQQAKCGKLCSLD